MDSIEQLSYLLFLRLLSERDQQLGVIQRSHTPIFQGEWARYSWDNVVSLTGDELFDTLRSVIERLHELPGLTPTGRELFRNANLKIYDRPTLKSVIAGVDSLDLTGQDGRDLKGDMYEYLLSKLSQSGTNGQFRTPRHIVDLIVKLVDPQPSQRIIDPACGTGGFLVKAYNHILRQHTKPADLERGNVDGSMLSGTEWTFLDQHAFTGYDNDANMVKLAIMNLYLHQLERANIGHFNPLTTTKNGQYPGHLYDVILANPPFAGKIEKESILADINLTTRSTELLFVQWFIDHLADGGKAGFIVPTGVLFGTTGAAKQIRKLLLDQVNLQAVISLPAGVFKPYAGVATAILVIENTNPTDKVWFYELTADGFSLTDTRTPIEDNDIPDLLERWPTKASGPHSFSVSRQEIAEQDDLLMPSFYRVSVQETVEMDNPAEILAELEEIERDILERINRLKRELEMLN